MMPLPWASARARAGGTSADVIVIGAGAAGLMAARQLQDAGRSVIVLDARNRIGGRIYTTTALGVPIDMGASWLEGANGNPVTNLATSFGMPRVGVGEKVALYAKKKRWKRNQVSQARRNFNKWWDQAVNWGERVPDNDVSWARGLRAIGHPLDRMDAGTRWFFRSEMEDEFGAGADELSLWWADEDQVFGGKDYMFPEGYVGIANGLAAGLDIQLNTAVSSVEYGDFGARVAAAGQTFTGSRAIVTVPLPILQTMSFSPGLPAEQQQAMNRLGMGTLDKVALRFPSVTWPKKPDLFGLATKRVAKVGEWWNMIRVTGQPILVALTAGQGAVWLERRSDSAVIKKVMKDLRKQTGWRLADPVAWDISRWHADPWSQGSYTIRPPGSKMKDHATLGAMPNASPLLIAGEATDPKYPSTVHGALLSGQRAASQILSDK